ncbi:MAG: SulP family inorganic anion transporter [Dermatophilaceae bacterium]
MPSRPAADREEVRMAKKGRTRAEPTGEHAPQLGRVGAKHTAASSSKAKSRPAERRVAKGRKASGSPDSHDHGQRAIASAAETLGVADSVAAAAQSDPAHPVGPAAVALPRGEVTTTPAVVGPTPTQSMPVHPEPDPSALGDPGVAGLTRRAAIEYETSPRHEHFLVTAFLSSTPGLDTMRRYRRRWLRLDIFAGVAVAAYLVPQVMAYSAIVNVAPVVGLWTALAALVVYAVMGQSRMLSVGPESTVALMAGAAIAPLSGGDAQKAIALGAALSIVVAGWCFLARMARLGVVAELLSQPLLVGYLAGGAVLMIVGQLGKMTGTTVTGETIVEQMRSFAAVVPQTDLVTLMVGLGTLVLIIGIHLVRPRWPSPLLAVAAATVVATVFRLQDYGVAVVGPVPRGLPAPSFPSIPLADWQALLLAGVGVAIVAYGDNTLIARGFPAPIGKGEDRAVNSVDGQKELVALGGVHVATGLFGGFPVSSSGSRTALALASGARTQVYSLVCAGCVVIVLFIAGPLIASLPQAALGAVVFYAASKLVSWKELRRLAKFRRRELLLAVATTLGTVLFGILAGVGIAITLSFLEMAARLARPHDGVLGRVPGLAGMHDVADHPDAQTLPGLVVYRYDAPLFFANVADLQRRALLVVDQENRAYPDTPARWFILNVEANVEVDITAADGLRELHGDLAERGVRFGLARVKHDLFEPLSRAGLTQLIGADMLFPTLPVAEQAYLDWAAAEAAAASPPPHTDGNPSPDAPLEGAIVPPAPSPRSAPAPVPNAHVTLPAVTAAPSVSPPTGDRPGDADN